LTGVRALLDSRILEQRSKRWGADSMPTFTRRQFLGKAAGAALTLPSLGAILAACSKPDTGENAAGQPGGRQLARPDQPVTLPLNGDPIATDTPIETGATLQIYNWADYIYKPVLRDFEERFDCKVEYSSFTTLEAAAERVLSGAQTPDVYFPGPSFLARLVEADILQPLNHELVPNMEANVWPTFWDGGPWYDVGWRYSAPYTVLTTGVGYRRDRVSDEEASAQGYELLWNPEYAGAISYYDSIRDAMGMAILRNGGTDVNTDDPGVIEAAAAAIRELVDKYQARLTYNGVYAKLPQGTFTVAQAWSGDIIGAQFFLPQHTSTDVLGYWYDADRGGVVGNDIMAIPTSAQNPRLAHEFINFMLEDKVAFSNFANWTGYVPPLRSIEPESLVDRGVVPKALASAVVTEDMMKSTYQLAELRPEAEQTWQDAWEEVKAGA
jgi:spermidine/putrescine transport system substrate-binding protein